MDFTHGSEPFYFANKKRLAAHRKALLHPVFFVVEPLQRYLAGTIADNNLINTPAGLSGEHLSCHQYFPGKNLIAAITQLTYLPDLAAIFVPVRQAIKQVLNRLESHFNKTLQNSRADTA